jgi:PQQ-dependent dehydrogenase (methanol/ethanol family)
MLRPWIAIRIAIFLGAALAACGGDPPEREPEPADAAAAAPADATGMTPSTDWPLHGLDPGEQRHSPLDQIRADNVAELGLAWSYELGTTRGVEATPIVVDGVVYVTATWSRVHALDAATGKRLWLYDPQVPRAWGRKACCDVVNRGVAVWQDRVFVGTLDGRLVALDRASGVPLWEVQTTPRDKPYTITGAPRVVKGKVLIGNGGAEFGVRGYVTAYDAVSGEQAWRFYMVPGDPSQPFEHPELEEAAKTWTGEWWKVGGGGTAWDAMAYDPELDLLYIGTGNGSPWTRYARSPGGGDNLYLCAILALRPDTGELVWHYQTTPGDNWDYTSVQHIVLADLEIDGAPRKVLMQAPKNGFFYVLDRATGELLSAEPYVGVTWASHVDLASGRPVETPESDYATQPRLLRPSVEGGHNWHPMSFHPGTGLVYIPSHESEYWFVNDPDYDPSQTQWALALDFDEQVERVEAEAPEFTGHLLAWDPVAGKRAWRVDHVAYWNGGVLSTAGGLVFQGAGDGRFVAYDAASGEVLWQTQGTTGIMAAPVTYQIDGVQYVAVAAGWGSAEELRRGKHLYNEHCFVCHGVSAKSSLVVPDLRYLTAERHATFEQIVRDGMLETRGMPRFAEDLSQTDAKAVHAYVIERAQELYAEQSAPSAD